jgi:hypothetical protein
MTTVNGRPRMTEVPARGTALFLIAAGLMVASGLIHLRLWFEAYRQLPTFRILFLVQVASAVVLALAVAVVRRPLVAAAGVALMAGTIVGFVVTRTVGIFGFHLPFTSGLAVWSLIVEAVAVALLAAAARLTLRPTGGLS